MSDQKRTPRPGPALPGKSPRPSPNSSAGPKGSGAKPPAAKAASSIRSNPATRSIPVIKPQQPVANGRPAQNDSAASGTAATPGKNGKTGKPGKTGRRIPGSKRPASSKGAVAKGLLGSKGGPKRPLRTGPGAKDASGPADEPTQPGNNPASSDAGTGGDAAEAEAGTGPAQVLPDLVSHTDAPAWLSSNGSRDDELWTGMFEAQVQDAAPVEPQIVPADEVQLSEPSLETPSISSDAAEAASLPETAAEVRAVTEEAIEAGRHAGISEAPPEGTEIAVDAGEGITELETSAEPPTENVDDEPVNGDPADGAPGSPADDADADGDVAADEPAAADQTEASEAEADEAGLEGDVAADETEAADETAAADQTQASEAADAEEDTETDASEASEDDAETEAASTDAADDEAGGDGTGQSDSGDKNPGKDSDPAKAAKTAGSKESAAEPEIAAATVSAGGTDVSAPVTDSFASLSLTKKVPAENPADTGITHTVTPSGSSAVPGDSRRARRTREAEEAAAKNSGASKTTRTLVLIGSILIVVLLGIWLATVVADGNREAGVLQDSVKPLDLEAGACLQDFQSVNAEVTVVTCDTPHNAQLVASQTYPDSDAFPGTDALAAKAEEVCSSVVYTDAASKYTDLELNRAVPTQGSWDSGDRRVDCFVVAPGEELTDSLIVQP
ncbi:septum formation family protein [Arthrobacter caoxuetaonis]|uniref:septum formation family protein n=1 Tax=Arthrobacter caoxuetaonis TaxID=2886935 RepID=UPI001D13EDC5|nr:septum formation family protein [Arthrobacter caoxuetaonis]MCC3281439.1 septum formation family protein [Arthrobacter caoxuetaonis]